MAKSRSKKDYFGMSKLLSIIFAIIPFTSALFGIITRLTEGKIVAALLRLLLGWNIIWLIDLIMMISKQKIWRLINF